MHRSVVTIKNFLKWNQLSQRPKQRISPFFVLFCFVFISVLFITLCTFLNLFIYWRRAPVNLSSHAPFKGGGFIVSRDVEVRSRHIGGAECDNSHCSRPQQEVSAWDPAPQIVHLLKARRCVSACGFTSVSLAGNFSFVCLVMQSHLCPRRFFLAFTFFFTKGQYDVMAVIYVGDSK